MYRYLCIYTIDNTGLPKQTPIPDPLIDEGEGKITVTIDF